MKSLLPLLIAAFSDHWKQKAPAIKMEIYDIRGNQRIEHDSTERNFIQISTPNRHRHH